VKLTEQIVTISIAEPTSIIVLASASAGFIIFIITALDS
jgi:hypothetical protein